ncbi:MAG: glycosyl hydrolase family 28-related protein [Granulicella sp.]
MFRLLCILVLVTETALDVGAQSLFTSRPDDPHAVYLERGSFGAVADGQKDDTDAIQAAIDRVQETTGEGVVFVADGKYRLSRTIHLWSGIRLVGYGAHRPVFLLGANTPGYQEGHEFLGTGRYMLQFASRRPALGAPVVDANEFTFFSGISNLDFVIGEGNPAAIAVRFHVAQHSFLQHMRFQVGGGRAAIEDVGNGASDLQIEGGEYGIISVRTSPAWQFLLMDSTFTGQRHAAIHTQEVGMTLLRDRISRTPIAVEVTPGMTEELYGRDLVLEDIAKSAVVLGDAQKAHNEVTLDHIVCHNVTRLVMGEPGADTMFAVKGRSGRYVEEHLTIGVSINVNGREEGVQVHHRERAGAGKPVPSDIPSLPPMQEWVNVHTLGVKGDGSDDTAALQAAIVQHRVLYLPIGTYAVSNTLRLRPDSVLIGFNPAKTLITPKDEAPAFQGEGEVTPVVESAKGGAAILVGIGIDTSPLDHRAAALVWRAGARSMVDDVNFARTPIRRPPPLSGGAAPAGRPPRGPSSAETQYPSLWVKDGGGGIFRGIWTSNTLAKAGLLVEDTTTPSIVYQMSCEHHMHHETQYHHVSNWTVYALQTEEENPAGADSFSVDLKDARHMLFANLFMYRVSRNVLPKLNAVEVANSTEVQFQNVHDFSMTRLAFDNSVWDEISGVRVRTHDFTVFTINPDLRIGAPLPLPAGVFAGESKLEQLANGFSDLAGLATDEAGRLYFTDAANHRIYSWNADIKKADILTDRVRTPMATGFAGHDSLLALDYSKAVFAINTRSGDTTKVDPTSTPLSGMNLMLPVGFHNSMDTLVKQMKRQGVVYAPRSNMAIVAAVENEARSFFYAPGSTNAIMAGGNWQPMLQASQWRLFHVGDEHFAASEEDDTLYRLKLDSLQQVTPTRFAWRGGSSVVTDAVGNVYLAEGQLYIYNARGKQIGVVEIPERPQSLAFGGPDNRTLFIGARGSLFSVQTAAAGR